MNKAQLIDAIAGDAKLTKADAKKALDAFDQSGINIQHLLQPVSRFHQAKMK